MRPKQLDVRLPFALLRTSERIGLPSVMRFGFARYGGGFLHMEPPVRHAKIHDRTICFDAVGEIRFRPPQIFAAGLPFRRIVEIKRRLDDRLVPFAVSGIRNRLAWFARRKLQRPAAEDVAAFEENRVARLECLYVDAGDAPPCGGDGRARRLVVAMFGIDIICRGGSYGNRQQATKDNCVCHGMKWHMKNSLSLEITLLASYPPHGYQCIRFIILLR